MNNITKLCLVISAFVFLGTTILLFGTTLQELTYENSAEFYGKLISIEERRTIGERHIYFVIEADIERDFIIRNPNLGNYNPIDVLEIGQIVYFRISQLNYYLSIYNNFTNIVTLRTENIEIITIDNYNEQLLNQYNTGGVTFATIAIASFLVFFHCVLILCNKNIFDYIANLISKSSKPKYWITSLYVIFCMLICIFFIVWGFVELDGTITSELLASWILLPAIIMTPVFFSFRKLESRKHLDKPIGLN